MITEIPQIEVKPGLEAEFEAAVKKATPIFKRSKGCQGMELRRSVEKPSRYRLFVSWETVEDHTVGFRCRSPEYPRSMVRPRRGRRYFLRRRTRPILG